jgi:hypothetical protein
VNTEKRHDGSGWGCPVTGCLGALVATIAAAVWIGIAAYGSETAGVRSTLLASFPVGALVSGALAAMAVRLAGKRSGALRWGAPLGCAFLGGAALLLAAVVFFQLIFPSL